MTRLAAVLLMTALLLATEGGPGRAATIGQAPRLGTSHIDGRTLFVAIAFGQGPADVVARVSATAAPVTPAVAAAIDRLTSRMSATERGFFDTFGEQIQSGNRVRIRAALEHARALSHAAAEAEFGLSHQFGSAPGPECVDVFVVVFFALAVVLFIDAVAVGVLDVNAVVLVNVEVAAAADTIVTVSAIQATSPGIARDLFVDRLARAFS